uniref:Calcyon neuron-specific vesicular protein n=1 Tax=Gasterosteus aculeatus aculeatus TaxID=481459 RepID=A0AAQ4NRJ8_GASAC
MVKIGSNLSDKLEKQPSADDGFDNIPLITPLEVNQLRQPFADKVIVKTVTQYQLQQKKNKLYVPNIKKLNINFYSDVSDKAKITGLILITLAFLTSLLLLLMYKAMWYDQLTCPEGFILKGSRSASGPPEKKASKPRDPRRCPPETTIYSLSFVTVTTYCNCLVTSISTVQYNKYRSEDNKGRINVFFFTTPP